MKNTYKIVPFEEMDVIVSVDGKVAEKHPFYIPSVALIYVKRGNLYVEIEEHKDIVPKGNFILLPRDTYGYMEKSWTLEEGSAKVMLFFLHQKFIQEVFQKYPSKLTNPSVASSKPIYIFPPNPILKGFFNSLESYLEGSEVEAELVELKTTEAILGILKFHSDCAALFQETVLDDKRINLQLLVETNYMYNIPLAKLAKLSGRSLSTFHREFKAIYKDTPSRWLLRRRLFAAREILIKTDQKPVNIYLELGFESLAHFSRAFKNEFGETLTEFRKSALNGI